MKGYGVEYRSTHDTYVINIFEAITSEDESFYLPNNEFMLKKKKFEIFDTQVTKCHINKPNFIIYNIN